MRYILNGYIRSAMDKGENQSPPDAVVVSDNTDGIFAVDVEVTVAGMDMKELSSTGKMFRVNGKKVSRT